MASSDDPLTNATSRRKCLLFAVPLLHANLAIIEGTVRRFAAEGSGWPRWALVSHLDRLRAAIGIVEQAADEGASAAHERAVREAFIRAKEAAVMDQDFQTAAHLRDVEDVLSATDPNEPQRVPHVRVARTLRRGALSGYYEGSPGTPEGKGVEAYRVACAACLADVFGPHPAPHFSAEWRTCTALAIAAQMYQSRDFSAMPILADALQDAGCESDDILTHCRDTNGTHVRGCWVTDLVLGKE